MISIWFKDLLFTLVRKFLLILFIIYFLFVLIDLSTNGVVFLKKDPSLLQCLKYLAFQTLLYADFLLPLCFMISLISTMVQKTQSFELCALQTAGISTKKIFSPFLLFSLLLILTSLSLSEWAYPKIASSYTHVKKAFGRTVKEPLIKIPLEDGSTIIAKKLKGKSLEDIFWIKNSEEIWHLKRVENSSPPIGYFVHKLQWDKEKDGLILSSTEPKIELPSLWSNLPLFPNAELLSLTDLKKTLSLHHWTKAEKARLMVLWQEKWLRPLLSFLLLLHLFPICLRFQRKKRISLLYLLAIFSFLSFHMATKSLAILAENQIISPFLIWAPFVLLLVVGIPLYFPKNIFKKNLCNNEAAS